MANGKCKVTFCQAKFTPLESRLPGCSGLRALICSSCEAKVAEGERFTRHGAGRGGEAILPRCMKYAPHEPVTEGRSALLEALLRPEGCGADDEPPDAGRMKAVEGQLGPALEGSRRRRK
jgi:predicted RNA-binding Zn-ribbon protein involved in translation (DUF1610 family)